MKEDIRIGIGVDSTEVTQGFSRVKKELRDLKQQTKEGFFDLEGEKRVERNLGNMVSGLANAKDGVEGLTVALDKMENVFQSSIAASVSVVALTELIKLIQQAKEEWEKYGAAAIKAQSDVYAALSQDDPTKAFESAGARIKELAKEIENFDSWRGKIGRGIASLFDAEFGSDQQRFFKMIQERRKLLELQGEASVQIAKEANNKIEEDNAEFLKNWDNLQEKAREKIRNERIKGEEEVAKKLEQQAQNEAEQYFRHYQDWLSKKDKADEEALQKKKQRMQEEEKLAEQQAERMFDQFKELQDAKSLLDEKTADRNKAYREQIIAEELKLPGQRNEERIAARQAASAEDRAIRRLAQKAQDKQNADWRNARMTNEQKEQMITQMKAQRAQDKQPQMEKDISEINKSIKKMEAKIGVQ